MHEPEPEQAPPQLIKTSPPPGDSERVTVVPAGNCTEHVDPPAPQFIPEGELGTALCMSGDKTTVSV
jgi:hypothetical protein